MNNFESHRILRELARIGASAKRYDDMRIFVEKLVKMKSEKGEDLDIDERNLLSVAYKNVVGTKRASWRTLVGGFDNCDDELLKKYRVVVENELEVVCNEVLALLTDHLCKNVKGNGDETEVYYLKMCGDYYGYLSEFKTDSEDIKQNTVKFYHQAMDVAEANLNETHPTRLRLALNLSVCYYDILKEPEKAIDMAKKSFDAAIEKFDTVEVYEDMAFSMQLMRDNVALWTSSQDDSDRTETSHHKKSGVINQHLSEHKTESQDKMTSITVDALIGDLGIEDISILVTVAEAAERYDDMCKLINKLVTLKSSKNEDLDTDQHQRFSTAFRNEFAAKRMSWRTLEEGFEFDNTSYGKRRKNEKCDFGDGDNMKRFATIMGKILEKYKMIVVEELEVICNDALVLLTDHLCKNVKGNGDETEVFYLKMCGDYYRYLSEFRSDSEEYKKNTVMYYQKAMDLAEANLPPSNSTRLELALNYSVCYFEILKEPNEAIDLAKKAIDASIESLDHNNKSDVEIMHLLRDNLTAWTSREDAGDDE